MLKFRVFENKGRLGRKASLYDRECPIASIVHGARLLSMDKDQALGACAELPRKTAAKRTVAG